MLAGWIKRRTWIAHVLAVAMMVSAGCDEGEDATADDTGDTAEEGAESQGPTADDSGDSAEEGAESQGPDTRFTLEVGPEGGRRAVRSSAEGADGMIVFRSADKFVYAVDGDDGEELWRYEVDARSTDNPTIAQDGMVFIGDDGDLHALEADGTQRWVFEGAGRSPAIGPDGTLYVASNGTTYAIDPDDGEELWTLPVGSGGRPAVAEDGTLFVTSGSPGKLYAFDTSDQSEKWRSERNFSLRNPSIAADGTVYVTASHLLLALDPDDGEEKWRFEPDWAWAHAPVIDEDGTLYVASHPNGLYAIDAEGEEQWHFEDVRAYKVPAIGSDGTVYAVGHAELFALDPEDAGVIWNMETTLNIRFDLLVASDGTVVVGTDDGILHALDDGLDGPADSPWPMAGANHRRTGMRPD